MSEFGTRAVTRHDTTHSNERVPLYRMRRQCPQCGLMFAARPDRKTCSATCGSIWHHRHKKWTDERTARLKELWESGFSAGKIAQDLKEFSRSAIIGRAHRLGLSRRKETAPGDLSIRKAARPGPVGRRSTHSTPLPNFRSDQDIPLSQRKSLLELTPWTCRWPVGEGKDLFFCGDLPISGCSYCPDHHRRAYV